ncbi:BOLA class I histocompatibility antigen, alpha chain BL3-7-like [Clarias gariepinus]|uniref:BOLA class I histocompatibility antigen, alpha chain BL3-7-like n=1 Tax=Clarias gariepinus TaxID=13013 RepID=UPI00234CBC8B|nr:BOLA class I histocompatibility antigen, alpha chain BL3-7-like [Clarias gariepinus]
MEHGRHGMKVLLFLTLHVHISSAVTHSLQYLYTAVTPEINFPEFTVVGLVDGREFEYYDSDIKKAIPKTEWIQNVTNDHPDFWNRHTGIYQHLEETLRKGLGIVMKNFNHTAGVHTLQLMYGCEIDNDGTTRGHMQLGYDGQDFLNFDVNNKTWISAKSQNEIRKQTWDYINGVTTDGWKNYVSINCINRINKYVSYGRETLERKVRPKVSVFHKHSSPSPEVVCHATGFFPKPLNITWQKDGEDMHEDVELRETLPNQDGSLQKRSILKVPAEELQKHNYTCVVQHSSLEKELVREVPKGGGSDGRLAGVRIAIIVVVVGLAVVGLAVGIVIWKMINFGFRPVARDQVEL